MAHKNTVSVRVPVSTRETAARLAERTGESITSVIAAAVRRFEDEDFYQQLGEATTRTFNGGEQETSYRAEFDPWMNTGLAGAVKDEPEEKFWR